jgi:hypothetical protein
MVAACMLRSSCCLKVVSARASASAYNSLAPSISFWAWPSSSLMAISSFASSDYFLSNHSRTTTTLCFSEVVHFFSMEPHIRRHTRSSSRFFNSHRNTSRACCSAKRDVSTASGTETYLGAPRPGCPMMTSCSSGAPSPMAVEVVTAAVWDAPIVRLVVAVGSPPASSLIVTEVVALATVVVSIFGTFSRTGLPSPHTTSIDGSWGHDTQEHLVLRQHLEHSRSQTCP